MENKIDLKGLIKRLSIETKFAQEMLEKDYHLTRILHKLSEKQITDLVFKGGTCLNKCYLDHYRLSEDLDFTYNKDVKDLPKTQIKKILNQLRKEFFDILDSLELKTDKKLGKGWKMLTSDKKPKIIGLEIITYYDSIIYGSPQAIKLEISFRKSLRKATRHETIKHIFIDELGNPILKKNMKLEVIDLAENFAEKFRALITRKRIAIRDIYDIYFILKNEIIAIDEEIIDLILLKINETRQFTKDDFVKFMKALQPKIAELSEKEMAAVIKTDETIDADKMSKMILDKFSKGICLADF